MTPAEADDVLASFSASGCVLIDFEEPAVPSETLAGLGRHFGAAIFHKLSDSLGVHPIRNLAGFPEYANTTHAELGLHTDGSFEQEPPRAMLMFCERASMSGGLTRLCDGRMLYRHLRASCPGVLQALTRPDAFRIRRDDRVSSKPVFREAAGRMQLSYRYGNDVHLDIHPDAQAGFAEIETYLAQPGNYLELRLEENQALILDNTRILHGRTAFPADSQRSLYGLWCDGRGVDAQRVRFGFEP
jgi:alpha-ketoglutarate-dependent taurine dioxygenase